MAHTPGPWFCDYKEFRLGDMHIRAGNGWLIAEVPHQILKQTQKANAALIAAAPELLEALEKLVNNLPIYEIELARSAWGNTNTRIILDAREEASQLLAKAKGGA